MSGIDDEQTAELAARLRALDPAASLPATDAARVARLLEETMSHDVDTTPDHHTDETRDTGTRSRSPLTWLVAAAALVVIAGVGVFAMVSQDDGADSVPTATRTTSSSVLALAARPPTSAKCIPVSAQILANQETAFDGTVTSIADALVTFDVVHWYRGSDADVVTVQAPPPDMVALVQAVDFQVGQRYLVSANGGFVTVCGFTAAYDDATAAMYAEAFAG